MAKAVCDVSKTATTAIDQVGQIGGLLNDQIIPALQQLITGRMGGGGNGSRQSQSQNQGQGQGQGQGLSQEDIAQMMASGEIPNPNTNPSPSNGGNGVGIGMDMGMGTGLGGYGQYPNPAMGNYPPNAPGRAFAGLLDRIIQAIPLLTQLQGMRQQPDPKAVLINNFTESLGLLEAVMGMTERLKKAVTTDLGMVEKAANVGQKVKKAVKREDNE